ncbi:MAG: MmcB family DNA repair protein [Pseudomonadota bacterium]
MDVNAPDDDTPEHPFTGVTGLDVARGVMRHLAECGAVALTEVPVNRRRRVDVMAMTSAGTLIIVEVKVSLADLRGDQKWPEYLAYCDQFYFAVPPQFPVDVLDEDRFRPAEAGLILADAFAGHCARTAPVQKIAPARRKAQTILFARRAAMRLQALEDPGFRQPWA